MPGASVGCTQPSCSTILRACTRGRPVARRRCAGHLLRAGPRGRNGRNARPIATAAANSGLASSDRRSTQRVACSAGGRGTRRGHDRAADVEQPAVLDAGRTGRLAAAAGEAAVEVQLRLRGRRRAFEHLLDEVDAPARAVELVAQELVGRAGRGAEPAVDAATQDGVGFPALGRVPDECGERGLHGESEIRIHPAAVQDALRVEVRLQPPVQARAAARAAAGTRRRPCRRRGRASRARRAQPPRRAAPARRRARRRSSQRNAPPHSTSCAPPSSAYGAVALTDSRHSARPGARAAAKNGCVCSRTLAEEVVAGREPHRRRCGRRRPRPPGRRRPRARAGGRRPGRSPTAAAAARPSRRLGARLRPAGTRAPASPPPSGSGWHLSEISSSNPSVPSAPAISRATSKPATFFITRPPNARSAPLPVEDPHAQHEVAHRAGVGPARPGQARGDRAAERRARAEVRRLEREHLPGVGERALDVGERRAGARRHHELGRIVVDDAGVGRRVEHLADALPGRRNPCCRRRG